MALQEPNAEIAGATLAVFKSSHSAERAFCSRCGTNIYHRPQIGPELAVSAGLFDPRDLVLSSEIFHNRKPGFYDINAAAIRKSSFRMAVEWAPRLIWRRIRRG